MQYTMLQAALVWRQKFVRRASCFSKKKRGARTRTRCTGSLWKTGAKFRPVV